MACEDKDDMVFLGLDAGSTTVKLVVRDAAGQLLFRDYLRHCADVYGSCLLLLDRVQELCGGHPVKICLTGSAGMGISEKLGLPFVQEVVASATLAAKEFPQIRTLVDIGGEDAKLIFFRPGQAPDIRMNGSCAGGTGAFLDQMAALLACEVSHLDELAGKSTRTYPIASRCGVFSKTDVQNLLSRHVARTDIAASVFHAIAVQIITSLARGHELQPGILLCGGPFAFLPRLRETFAQVAGIPAGAFSISDHAAHIPAWGASYHCDPRAQSLSHADLTVLFRSLKNKAPDDSSQRHRPLFTSAAEFEKWAGRGSAYTLPAAEIQSLKDQDCYLGIDSGSTTTKMVVLNRSGHMVFHAYEKNHGNSLDTAYRCIQRFVAEAGAAGIQPVIAASCATGYGEDLIRNALDLNGSLVETMAHYKAACHFSRDISFILDIGGQDMKAIFIHDGVVTRLEINEACSSGCGSFIETFAQGLNYGVSDFARIACLAKNPCDLGTRCTVFMNSRVKQYLREGAPVEDLSAGLSYSVIHNCLQKVLKIKDYSVLGQYIMIQGGAFRNPSLVRALELELGREVMITDHPELMGAFGAALEARELAQSGTEVRPLSGFPASGSIEQKNLQCLACDNNCHITRFTFSGKKHYYSGNKCERVYSNRGTGHERGISIYEEKYRLLFDRRSPGGSIRVGIPRALGIYENYPFWHSLLSACGAEVVLSGTSTMPLYESGVSGIMSENICFPAKLAHGHILDLIARGVDRIFMPFVVYESDECDGSPNTYNCPIVTAYSEVIKSALDPAGRHGIPLDAPSFSFRDRDLLMKACYAYLSGIQGIKKLNRRVFRTVFEAALAAQKEYEHTLKQRCREIAERAAREKRLLIVLAGRPYHSDPLIQHKIADYIADSGADVISEDLMRYEAAPDHEVQLVMQWAYTTRIIKSAEWVARQGPLVHFVELTSFGCGPDAFMLDEIDDLLRRSGKNACFLKIDDITNTGSMKLRLRSLIESLRLIAEESSPTRAEATHVPPYLESDRSRRILMPWFGDFYSPFLPPMFALLGYEAENLPPPDRESAELGLRYSNNEVCYPATLIVGDFMKALLSGKYRREDIALAITQTGGQCRATNYLSLLKKTMVSAGFGDIPVISIGIGTGTYNDQPGFELRWGKIYRELIYSIVFADCLSQLYHATLPRSSRKQEVIALRDHYFEAGCALIRSRKPRQFADLAEEAAAAFMSLTEKQVVPRVGVVGEIFVKYNSFGNRKVVQWLLDHDIEAVIPPITSFFLEGLASSEIRIREKVERREHPKILKNLLESYVFSIIRRMESRMSGFPWYRPIGNPHKEAARAAEIINPNAQFGEGWLIPAEFARFAEDGIHDVVSFQPFGCIANHIISKGVEKRTRSLYPELNLLFLDFDSGMSDVNIFNRLHFIAQHAISKCQRTEACI